MVYSVEEVAEILKVSVQTVRNLVKTRALKSFKVGVQIRIKKEDLDRYIEQQSTH